MSKFTIYSPTGTALYTGTPTFTGQYMKPGLLEFREVSVPDILDLAPGCYVDYTRTGFRYRIYTVPQVKKQARSLSYGAAFVHQGVQLFDASKMLEYCPFRDLVKGDNRIHFSTQPSISTYEGCDGLARRFEACLRDQYDVNGVQSWAVRIATQEENPDLYELMTEPREFTVSGVNILECLDKVYEIWPEVGWVYKVENGIDTIVIGGGGINANQGTYAYGKGRGLKSLTRTVANADEMANRIYAYGSSQNMLPRWYNSQEIKDADSVDIQNLMIPVSDWGETGGEPDAAKAYVEDATSIARNGLRPTTVYFDGGGEYPAIYPSIRDTTIKMVRDALGSSSEPYYPSTTVYTDENVRVDRLLSVDGTFDKGLAAVDGKSSVVSESADVSGSGSGSIPARSTYTTQFFTKSFSSPDGGTMSLNAALNLSGTVYSDAGGVTLQVSFTKNGATVYNQSIPLERTGAGAWRFSETVSTATNVPVSSGDTIACTASIILSNSGTTAESYSYSVTGSCSFKMSYYRAKTFEVTIRQVGFDIGAQADLGDGKTIAMRTGMCAGRSFAVKECYYNSSSDSWTLECWRSEDESLAQWFPNSDYPVRGLENVGQSNEYPGDEFVILDIAMPDIYVQMAELKLLDAAEDLLADTATERWQYIPEIDAKYMVENSRTIRAGEYMAIIDITVDDAGDVVYFRHSGGGYFLTSGGDRIVLSGSGSVVNSIVDTVVINEGEAAIPTYKVTLRDRKRKTWTESEGAPTSSSKSVGGTTSTESSQQGSIDLSGYVQTDEFEALSIRVSALEDESFFELDGNGNVTLKSDYDNLWVPGWFAAGGIGTGGGGGGVSSFYDLPEIGITSSTVITAGQVLTYNGTSWVNANLGVSVSNTIADGTTGYARVATITINGVSVNINAPADGGGGGGGTEVDPVFTNSAAYGITSTDITNWDAKLTGISMNGNLATVVNGVANLGTVLTSHQTVTLASGTNDGTLKITTAAGTVDNIAVTGLGSLAFQSSHQTIYALTLQAGSFSADTYTPNSAAKTVNIPTTLDHIVDGTNRKLSDYALASSLNNYVTLSTAQTISGSKTFTPAITASGGIILGGDAYPSTDLGASLGYSSQRFANVNGRTFSAQEINFKLASSPSTASGYLGFAYGWMVLRTSSSAIDTSDATTYKQINFHQTYGFYPETTGDINLGYTTKRWATVYGVDANFSGIVTVNGVNSIDQSDSNMSMYNYGARGTKSFDAYGNSINFRVHNSNNQQVNILAVNPTKIQAGSDVIPNYTTGLKLGGNSSDQRWAKVYAVDTDLTGNLLMTSTGHIDIGPLRMEYDATNKALHITKVSGSDANAYGLYADGFVSAGGLASNGGYVKYVNCASQTEYNNIGTKDNGTIYTVGTTTITKVYLGTIVLFSES